MLRITTSHSAEGAKKYFDVSLKTSDYYTRDIGTWGGKGAAILGLKGEVDRRDFVALINNRWPGANGERLTARIKTRMEDVKNKKTGLPVIHPETGDVQQREVSNRRVGYDFTFSVPKSVSLYLAINEDKVVEEVIAQALDETIATIECRMETKVARGTQNLLDARAAKELAIQHLFEQVSLKRELHIAGMLLRRGIARVSAAEALAWVKSDPLFVRPDPDGKLLTTREVRDAERKMIHLAARGQGKHEALRGGKEWVIRHPLVAASEEQSNAVRHVLASEDFVISFKGPAGAGKTEIMTEAVTAIESLSGKGVTLLAPSSPSVEVLRAQGFARANTLNNSNSIRSCSKW